MERETDRSPDVQQAAERLSRPRARVALALKRFLDVGLAFAMIVALLPLFALVAAGAAGSSSASGSGGTGAG